MKISVSFTGFTENQKKIFGQAAQFWANVIVSQTMVQINVETKPIDGVGKILGQASPTEFYFTGLPSSGKMTYDSADIAQMEANGSLLAVMKHEIAHVLGFGTIWESFRLLLNDGPNNPIFIGKNAMREYGKLLGIRVGPIPVPVSNDRERDGKMKLGTYGSHWREITFDNELMTGYINLPRDPISRLTLASLEDLGYQVDYNLAQSYVLPENRKVVPVAARTMHKFVSLPIFRPLYLPVRDPIPIGYSGNWRRIGAPVNAPFQLPPTSRYSYLDLVEQDSYMPQDYLKQVEDRYTDIFGEDPNCVDNINAMYEDYEFFLKICRAVRRIDTDHNGEEIEPLDEEIIEGAKRAWQCQYKQDKVGFKL